VQKGGRGLRSHITRLREKVMLRMIMMMMMTMMMMRMMTTTTM
jgi:hypothetical protein